MRNFVVSLIMCILFAGTAWCDPLTIGFENYYSAIGYNNTWAYGFPSEYGRIAETKSENGADQYTVTYAEHGVSFQVHYGYDDLFGYGFWSGIGLSTRIDSGDGGWYDNGNDLFVTGGGNNGSSTYAVVYGTSQSSLYYSEPSDAWQYEHLPSISLPDNITLQSMAITNTAYVYDTITNGNSYADPLGPDGDFTLWIYGIANGELFASLDIRLDLLDGWETISLLSLTGSEELRFAFTSSDTGSWGINTPTYFAFDDFTFTLKNSSVPEPATLAIVGLGLAGLGWARRKKAETQP